MCSPFCRRRGRLAAVELLLLVGNAIAYLSLVFWVLPLAKACAFIAIQQCLFGLYLGFTFAPNHKGMPIIAEGTNLPFAYRQVVTARNIVGGRFVTMAFGGLNYQIEHHLFPAMPRLNLAHAQPFVREFCAQHDLPYRQVGITSSYARRCARCSREMAWARSRFSSLAPRSYLGQAADVGREVR